MVKRDDLTGLAFGGNKTRKFDLALGDALAQGATAVVTGAASQSNHARQAAAAAAKLGMKCVLVNRHDHRSLMGIQGNQLLDNILGADVRLVADGVNQEEVKNRVLEELRAQGEKPYLIGRAGGGAGYGGVRRLRAGDCRATRGHGRTDGFHLYGVRAWNARGAGIGREGAGTAGSSAGIFAQQGGRGAAEGATRGSRQRSGGAHGTGCSNDGW